MNDAVCHGHDFYHEEIETGCIEKCGSGIRGIVRGKWRVKRHFCAVEVCICEEELDWYEACWGDGDVFEREG